MIYRLVSVVVLIWTAAAAQDQLPAEIVERDKPYGGHPRQVIDVAARPVQGLKPALLLVHGGGWQAGDKRSTNAKVRHFLQEGFAVAAMNYRLHPEVDPTAQADDVAAGAVWLAKNADRFGIDPGQIYLIGHASGAHLVSLVGTDPAYLRKYGAEPGDLGGVIALDSGAYDVPAEIAATTPETVEGRLLRQVFGDTAAYWPRVSPAYLSASARNLPPFFIAYSGGRENFYRQARPFAQSLRKAGAVAVLFESVGRDEESIFRFFGTEGDATTEAVSNFIRREAEIPVVRVSTRSKEPLPPIPWLFAFEAPEIDVDERRLTGTQISEITAHDGRLFAGNGYPNEAEERRRGQIFRLDAREERWRLDMQMPLGYTKVSALEEVRFETDGEGAIIEPLDYLLAGAVFDPQDQKPSPAGLFIRTPSGTWTKQELASIENAEAAVEVAALGSWRDPQTGADLVFAGLSPHPLGIHRGVFDPASPGGIKFDAAAEFVLRERESMVSFSVCGGNLFAATNRRILSRRRSEPSWDVLVDFNALTSIRPYLEDLDVYWQRNYEISSLRCDLSQKKLTLTFSALGRTFRFTPGEDAPIVERNLINLIRSELGREPHFVITSGASMIRQRGRDIEEWIGLEVYYDLDYLAALPEFPYWPTGFGKDAWYLVRTVVGGQINYRLEQIIIPGVDPNTRPLAKVIDFERSPFEQDNAVYVGGFKPWFEEVSNTAWIARGEL